jgi:hypothetical protein
VLEKLLVYLTLVVTVFLVIETRGGLEEVPHEPRLIFWNMNQGRKRSKVRNLLRQWKADFICLQETKLELISNRIVRRLWGCKYILIGATFLLARLPVVSC